MQEKRFTRRELLGFLALIFLLLLMCVAAVAAWPFIKEAFQDGGTQGVIDRVKGLGHWSILAMLAMQVLQVVITFIPGEVVQVAAGLLYGPWGGTLIVLFGCVLASAFTFVLVRKLGAPFVHAMVGDDHLVSFRQFERSGKLDWVVFILFLIPGLPKDTFNYLVPLTYMTMSRFLLLSTVGRIPGVFVSCFAASDIAEGNYVRAGIIFSLGAVIALVGVLKRDFLMEKVNGLHLRSNVTVKMSKIRKNEGGRRA